MCEFAGSQARDFVRLMDDFWRLVLNEQRGHEYTVSYSEDFV